jgi:ribosome biogenesis GTPase / thiamine phosphate phosphatase
VPALSTLGWDDRWIEAFAPFAAEGLVPGRVVRQHRGLYRVLTEPGEVVATPAGRLRLDARGRIDLPAVGDWVALRGETATARAVVQAVVPRRSAFVRRAAGDNTTEQVVAANVDSVLLVSGLDHDFNPRRIERYVLLAWESGARPVVVLNKADLRDDAEACRREIEQVAPGVDVHAVSTRDPQTLAVLEPYLRPAQTVALLGSSGVGKSTLLNRLLGSEVQATRAVREHDQRGRHTTSDRHLFVLPSGALAIDTPGMRELQLWESGGGLQATFEDVDSLAPTCRFRDCTHQAEPGCAVRAAVAEGRLAGDRLESFHKLRAELRHVERKQDERAQAEDNRKVRAIHKAARKHRPRE